MNAGSSRRFKDFTMDLDFMYGWSFRDPDGHLWEVLWIDPSALREEAVAAEYRAGS
jgi:predicted lactoylglutathione lyase